MKTGSDIGMLTILKCFETGSRLYIMLWIRLLIFTEREIRTRKTIVGVN